MEDIKTKTINNVFEFSRKSIGVFEEFKWHKDRYGNTDTYKGHSSQALMLDVFGLMKNTKSKNKLVNSLFNLREENWDITFEYDNKDILNEIAPTQVDVMLSSKNYLICIECKFTENDGGSCSQIKRLDSGIKQCNGNYQLQINERFGTENKCALTGKGIKYWDYIDELYTRYSSEKEYMPCPFKSGNYQWMRNVCFTYALGKRLKKKSCFYICYYDDEHLTFADNVQKRSQIR